MAQQSPTPIVSLVDVLAMTDKVDESRLVQLLAKLETAQIVIALVKSLNLEEDKVCEVDETAILRLDATKACLGPALSDLQKASQEFTQFLANVPIADSQVFIPYKFAETSLKLQSIYDTELMKAVGRWHFALQAVCVRSRRSPRKSGRARRSTLSTNRLSNRKFSTETWSQNWGRTTWWRRRG